MSHCTIECRLPGIAQRADEPTRKATLDSLDVFEELGERIQWVRTYVVEDNAYCIYVARGECSMHGHAGRPRTAAERIAEVRSLMQPAGTTSAPENA
ncbi:MAG: nickel-binding protein [Rhodanobacteraceae bacterium]